jgi:hypothetical protein
VRDEVLEVDFYYRIDRNDLDVKVQDSHETKRKKRVGGGEWGGEED